jgi:hypothetical protein
LRACSCNAGSRFRQSAVKMRNLVMPSALRESSRSTQCSADPARVKVSINSSVAALRKHGAGWGYDRCNKPAGRCLPPKFRHYDRKAPFALNRHAAVDRKLRASGKTRRQRNQEQRRLGDLSGLPHPPLRVDCNMRSHIRGSMPSRIGVSINGAGAMPALEHRGPDSKTATLAKKASPGWHRPQHNGDLAQWHCQLVGTHPV